MKKQNIIKYAGSLSIFASFALLFAFSGRAWPQQDWNVFDSLTQDTCSVDKPCGPGVSTAPAIPALELIGMGSRPSLELSGSGKTPHAEAGKPAQALKKAPERKNLRLSKILIIALADTINPCALAVFILMLVGILSYNATSRRAVLGSTARRTVLHAGFAFTLAVFIMYFIYGLIIIRFWQLVQALTSVRLWLHTILGIAAICLGIFHLKDFLRYKPGSFATEMPVGWRGTVRKMMISITSPAGAFFMGAFVTLFLIPCTMGPYLIAGGILSQLELIKTIPWLIIYNLVFIAPLIGIVYIVYFGFRKVEDVSQWKNRNIRKLHLIVALIMIPMGLAILLGWL